MIINTHLKVTQHFFATHQLLHKTLIYRITRLEQGYGKSSSWSFIHIVFYVSIIFFLALKRYVWSHTSKQDMLGRHAI